MGFLTLIKQSIYSPEFYRGLFAKPLSFSIKYFYMLALTVSLVVTVVFSFTLLPTISSFLKNVGPAVSAYFPDELVLTIKNGEVSVNVPEPYVLPIPAALENIPVENGRDEGRLPTNLVVIDTKNEFSEETFAAYDTMVLLMKRSVAFSNGDGKIRIEPLRDIPDATIDKAFVGTITSKVSSFLKVMVPVLVFGIFIISIAVFTFHLVYLLVAALLVWLVMKMRKVEGGYKKAYQVGIHAMTLGLLINTFFVLVLWPKPAIPFLFTIILLIVAAVNVKPGEVVSPEIPPPAGGPA